MSNKHLVLIAFLLVMAAFSGCATAPDKTLRSAEDILDTHHFCKGNRSVFG